MCSMYWNLRASYECPDCGERVEDDLQTHWMGRPMSCEHYYELGQPVAELKGVPNTVIGPVGTDDFTGVCDNCQSFIDLAGEIVDEAVVRVWPVRWMDAAGDRHEVAA